MSEQAHTLLARRFSTDSEVPVPFSIIKLRLPIALEGPGSLIASSAVTGATRENYHSAIVRSVAPDFVQQRLHIRVWAIPSYSCADDPADWLATQHPSFRDRHIPVPCADDTGTPRANPAAFGPPLGILGYVDRRPSWVLLREIEFDLPFSQRWKRLDPVVLLPQAEMGRLEVYNHRLDLALAGDTHVSLMLAPPPSAGVYELFESIYADAYSSDDDSNDDVDDDRGEDMFAFLRALAPGCADIEEVVARHDREVKSKKVRMVEMWMEDAC